MTVILRPFCLPILGAAAVIAAGAGPFAFAETPELTRTNLGMGARAGCQAPADLTRLDQSLARTARRVAAGQPLKIVAIGSSSTAGAGASSPAASYPSRLAVVLQQRFPNVPITVINRGANGEEACDMVARFDQAVIAENPDLVIWQIGTNTVLRDNPLPPTTKLLQEGLARLKSAGSDVILIDPQFAPKVLAKRDVDNMVDLIATTAKAEHVGLFHRFAVMRHWRQVARIPFEAFLANDELHMNDWSYDCVAQLLGNAIAESVNRSTQTATAVPAR